MSGVGRATTLFRGAAPWWKARWKRIVGWTVGVVLPLWFAFLLFVGWAMRQPPEKFGRVMMHMPVAAYFLFPFETMWTQARSGALQPGDPAPDFQLPAYDKSGEVHLASFRGAQPVVLVFGSYT